MIQCIFEALKCAKLWWKFKKPHVWVPFPTFINVEHLSKIWKCIRSSSQSYIGSQEVILSWHQPSSLKAGLKPPYHYCNALHCTALHCTALHCTALPCTVMHYTVLHCNALHCTALQCTLYDCTALQQAESAMQQWQASIETGASSLDDSSTVGASQSWHT